MKMKKIGEVVAELAISADTLRYYEKIKLLPRVQRNSAGLRLYTKQDISRIKFIKRAQKMSFSLEAIGQLLAFRENPQTAKSQVRQLAHDKLEIVKQRVEDLVLLRDELTLLVSLCGTSESGCPILEELDQPLDNDNNSR